jgi:Major Facilitator Superfamily
MTSVFIANGLAFGAWVGNLPRLREEAGLDNASLGIVLLCGSIGSLLAMQMVGRLAGRIGTARTSWISAAALVVALPLPSLLPAGPLLLASGLLLGAVLGSLDVAMNAHAAQVERGWGTALMSSFHAGWSLGELAGAAAAGLLADAGTSLFVALAVSGIASAVCGLAALLLPDAPPCSSEQTGFAWPSRAMLGLCAIGALSFGVEGSAADWCGVYLRTELGASAALSSMGLAAFAAAMVVCRLCGDLAVRWLGPVRVICWGGMMTGLGLLGAIVSPSVTAAAISFAFVGLGVANTIPVLFSAAGRNGPAGVAMVATAGYGAVMGAPPLIGIMSDAVGLRAALLLLMAGAGLITLLARRSRALA